MRKDQIVAGKAYVNESDCIMREVMEDVDSRRIRLTAFDLRDGKLVPTRHNIWDRAALARWADREASPREVARAHPYGSAWLDTALPGEAAGAAPENARTDSEQMPNNLIFPIGK